MYYIIYINYIINSVLVSVFVSFHAVDSFTNIIGFFSLFQVQIKPNINQGHSDQ